jgi:Flp pilus assembly pilin Flp
MMKMRKLTKESGATFIEYAMLAGLIAIVVAIAAAFFGKHVKGVFSESGKQTQQIETNVQGAKIDGDFTPAQ